MVLDRIFGGVGTLDPDFMYYDLQGQGFSRNEAKNLDFLVKKNSHGYWLSLAAGLLMIPLTSKLRKSIMKETISSFKNQDIGKMMNPVMLLSNISNLSIYLLQKLLSHLLLFSY